MQAKETYLASTTWTVHTSAKARLTSAAVGVCLISMSSRLVSVNHFMYHDPNSDESEKQSLYPDSDSDRHQNLIVYLTAHCQPSLKISCKSVRKFLRKVANRQTDKQTSTTPPCRR